MKFVIQTLSTNWPPGPICSESWNVCGCVRKKCVSRCYLVVLPNIFNRPCVAGAVLQSPPVLINWFIKWSFSSNIFQPLQCTVNLKPEELVSWNFERTFIPHYGSCVTCHVSPVTCPFFCLKKIGLSGGASRWRVCYQRGLPRLVFVRVLLFTNVEKFYVSRMGDLKNWNQKTTFYHVQYKCYDIIIF